LRNIRAETKLDPKKKIVAEVYIGDQTTRDRIQEHQDGILRLGMLSELRILSKPPEQTGGAVRSTDQFDVRVPYVADKVDVTAELSRLRKEIEGLQKAVAAKERQLGDETFRSRAPEKIVQGLVTTLAQQRTELQKSVERLGQLERNT
jgi:valyl-tRNA synthetase